MEEQIIITSLTIPKLKTLIGECVREELKYHNSPPPNKEESEFVNDPKARTILSGNPEKPISKPFLISYAIKVSSMTTQSAMEGMLYSSVVR